MQILSCHNPTTDQIQLNYDIEAQIAFGRAYSLTKTVGRMRHVQEILGAKCKIIQARLFIGTDLLRELTENTGRQIDVSALDLQTCIEAAMFASNYRIQAGKADPFLAEAIMLLAQVTLFPVLPLPLPPASEVFDKGSVPVSVLHGYETIRQSKKPGEQSLALLDLYQLWHALDQINPANAQLRGLLQILDLLTGMFRATMEARALVAVATLNPKAKRQRRKS